MVDAQNSGSVVKAPMSAMPPAIVSCDTRPSTSAPVNSKTMAMTTAHLRDSVLAPTEVPLRTLQAAARQLHVAAVRQACHAQGVGDIVTAGACELTN